MKHILELRKFVVQDKKTGTIFDDADTIEKAEEIVQFFEKIDEEGGNFKEESYEIVTRDQLREELPSNYTVIDIPAGVEADGEEYIPLF